MIRVLSCVVRKKLALDPSNYSDTVSLFLQLSAIEFYLFSKFVYVYKHTVSIPNKYCDQYHIIHLEN